MILIDLVAKPRQRPTAGSESVSPPEAVDKRWRNAHFCRARPTRRRRSHEDRSSPLSWAVTSTPAPATEVP